MYQYARLIGQKAREALIEEAMTTPKPGLVDCFSNGAHKDMDLDMFLHSTKALEPYFVRMAQLGSRYSMEPQRLFGMIRQVGLEAERAMYEVTAGVNTHKGAIFTMGILAASAGACMVRNGQVTVEAWIAVEQEMVREILLRELEKLSAAVVACPTHGEKNLVRYGSLGVRGEAAFGYPSVRELALPVLQAGRKAGYDWNLVKLQTLFSLMRQVEDGNVLTRTGVEGLKEVQRIAGWFLEAGGAYQAEAVTVLQRMDQEFIRNNYSNGGCADLLAAAIFMESVVMAVVEGQENNH